MISCVVLVKDEEKTIETCLQSIRSLVDEMIVIDDDSEDKTIEKAKKFGARVFKRPLKCDFAAQRNFGLKQAKGDWVLFIDADEQITTGLAEEIKTAVKKKEFNGFYLRRQEWFGGKWLRYGETGRIRLLRLGKKGVGKWQRKVHETWRIRGKVGELKNPLLHYSHQNISQFLGQINFHSTLHAQALKEEGVKFSLFRLIFNPLGKFIQNYIFRLGFLDGVSGFIFAMMMSFHSFLARAKLYQLWKK